jgi:hypothetical protein
VIHSREKGGSPVAELLAKHDPALVVLVFLPAAFFIAAWALRMACEFSAVEPPDFWQSLLCVFLVIVSNVLLRYWVNISVADPGLGSQLLWPLVMSASIVAVMLRTGPFSALMVTLCEGAFCMVLYLCFSMLSARLLTVL